ncbi:unnamed protein product [Boreogadus saida]
MLYGPILLEAAALSGEKVMRNAGVQEEGGFHGGNEAELCLAIEIKVTALAAMSSLRLFWALYNITPARFLPSTHTQIKRFEEKEFMMTQTAMHDVVWDWLIGSGLTQLLGLFSL